MAAFVWNRDISAAQSEFYDVIFHYHWGRGETLAGYQKINMVATVTPIVPPSPPLLLWCSL